jgi:hypothetical protein
MRASTISVQCLCMALAFAGGPLLFGCSSDEARGTPSESAVASGRVALGLTTRGASGSLYRLREAAFQIVQQNGGPFGGFVTFLFSEDDPLSSTLETTLPVADYSVELFSGWVLEKVENGEVTRVQANLLSSPLQFFGIARDEESFVSYRFETGGEVIEFGEGRLVIDIEVEERAPITLGEPLEIVDGAISSDSNAHGIEASLFVVTAERGATLEVTEQTGSICVAGLLDPVQDEDFATQWGALFGFSFLSEELENVPWDRDGGSVAGFSFTVTGAEIPPSFRFGALPGNGDPSVDNFCAPLVGQIGETFEVSIESMTRDCWQAGGQPLITPDLLNIAWTLPADSFVSHPFDFCISDLRPILR